MKIELRCPGCSESYLVERSTLPADGGALPCVACGGTITVAPAVPPVGAARAGHAPPAPPHAGGGGVPPAATRAATARAAAHPAPGPTATPAMRGGEEVVCPRCKLHFVPRKAHADAVAAARGGDRPTILLVEDMDYFQEIARESLGTRFEVRTATTVDEARAEIATGIVDLMIIDLPGEGGAEGLALLRELQPKRFPILLFTAQDESEMYGGRWEQLQHLGADDLVMKGMNVGEVLLRKSAELLGMELAEEDVRD